MTHAPFIPLREAKNRDVGCQGQLKGNPGVVSADRIRRFHTQETEVCTESCPEGTGLGQATDMSPAGFEWKPLFGVAAR